MLQQHLGRGREKGPGTDVRLGTSAQSGAAKPVREGSLPGCIRMVSGLQCQVSVLGHGRGNELQLEVLILEDAVESRATLGATEWPVAVAAAILGEFCKEGQL